MISSFANQIECGYVERREEASCALFFLKKLHEGGQYPTLINVFYTTRGVMTKLSHPKSGYNQLWRSSAYNSEESLRAIFENPRRHTGKGYRSTDETKRGCSKCGMEKPKSEFSKNQWSKNVGDSKCAACIGNNKQQGKTVGATDAVYDEMSQLQAPGETTGAAATEAEINYEYMRCDAAGCGRPGAIISCSHCRMAFYCSDSCLRRHKPTHMGDCRLGASMKARFSAHPDPPRDVLHGLRMAAHLAGRRDFQGLLLQAQFWQDEENWEGAFETYQAIFEEMINRSPPEQRQVMMGICRCLYEMGRFEHAIAIGQAAIEMNRHFEGVHKYVALAQRQTVILRAPSPP